jgi:predicted transcriptional regulator YdeE
MQYEKTYRPAFSIVGIACRTSRRHPAKTGSLWRRFREENIAAQIIERSSNAVYALYCEYDSDDDGEYTLVLGCEVPTDAQIAQETPDGLVVAAVPGANYALIDARGKQPDTLIEAWVDVSNSALRRTYICDFEVHWGPVAVEVYVSIE